MTRTVTTMTTTNNNRGKQPCNWAISGAGHLLVRMHCGLGTSATIDLAHASTSLISQLCLGEGQVACCCSFIFHLVLTLVHSFAFPTQVNCYFEQLIVDAGGCSVLVSGLWASSKADCVSFLVLEKDANVSCFFVLFSPP